jgi:glycosyltransferase involved in cell wall biosynthesis
MRILHLANHCDEVGNGIMNVAVDLVCKQAEFGHRAALASGGGAYVELIQRHGVEHFRIDQHWRRPAALMVAFRTLRRLIKSWEPDIIHAHMMTGALLARGLRRAAGFRLVTTVHNEWQQSAVLMGVGDRVIAVSDTVRDAMKRRGIPSRKLRVVKNGPLGSPRRLWLDGGDHSPVLDRPAIVTVAGMNERKGIRELIIAFGEIASREPSASLYLVGDGPDRLAFETLAKSGPCPDRIHFVGFVRDPRPYLAQADVFVLASRSDPFPLVIPEAREAGCAIVASAIGGIPEALDGGRAGILVPAQHPGALAKAVGDLLANPRELVRWRQRAAENLDWLQLDRVVQETLAIYKEVLHNKADRIRNPSHA